jgi:hypothetical protein
MHIVPTWPIIQLAAGTHAANAAKNSDPSIRRWP